MHSATLKLVFSFLLSSISHIILIVVSIIIYNKIKTKNSLTILIGSILIVLSYFGSSIINVLIANTSGVEAVARFQVINSYFNSISFFIFILGLLLFAINDLKKEK